MSAGAVRKVAIAEPVAVFLLIMAYIWDLRFTHHWWWVPILGVMVVSHGIRHERAGSLGFRVAGLADCWREYAPALAFFALALSAAGILFQTTRPVALNSAPLSWGAYLPWGLFQQYVLNAYFFNRLGGVMPGRAAALLAAGLFSGAHLPNWFLMGFTLAAGYCCASIYRRYQNLYFLGAAHGTIGFLVFMVVPDSISHHLKVGPGFFLH